MSNRDAVSARQSGPSRPSNSANSSPYKIVQKQPAQVTPKTTVRKPASIITTTEELRTVPAQSVLRRASAEFEAVEPAPHRINHAGAMPIIRSQSPEYFHSEVPANPLR